MKTFRTILCTLLSCAALSACDRGAPVSPVAPPVDTTQTLRLLSYHSIGAHVSEPSGLAYHRKNDALMTVSDAQSELYIIGYDGALKRRIATTSADLEGIAVSLTCDTIYVVEERTRQVVLYREDGTRISAFTVDVATSANNGLEGITVGPNGNLFVLNEKLPGMIVECTPAGTEIRRIPLSLASDYSGIMYDASDNSLWIVSDESMSLMKTDLNGTLKKQWPLPFSKGEGISIVRDTLYIVNDADAKLYVFKKPN